ncbi:MAG: type I restriction-modification system subunit M [Micrococcales bacterium]|nr:type I restriction-modification system subunit M [Micrococcales bacterium]MCL2668042.1 type I restriction-modification system subunit M [Micrococcales bacterium]
MRGAVDGWEFKQYVLGLLFYRYISENLTEYVNTLTREATDDESFDYAAQDDRYALKGRGRIVAEKGFFILPSNLFVNINATARDDPGLNETLAQAFGYIETSAYGQPSEDDFKGLFDDMDMNHKRLGATVAERNRRLVKMLGTIAGLDMDSSEFGQDAADIFGDAYEFLMTMYASSAGKSGGEFFTPQDVSALLTQIAAAGRKQVNRVYDPACGSGSLLLNFRKLLGPDAVRQGYYGQDVNLTTYNLCRINMLLHDVNFDKFSIAHGDTLTHPKHWDDQPFDAIVSNPPYSIDWIGDDDPNLINDPRYAPAGVLAPKKKKADLAFTMHMLHWLAQGGTAAIMQFPGAMYRGGAEAKIRKYLVDQNYVEAVIALPSALFFGTTIATYILVLHKGKTDDTVLFIDASAEWEKVPNKPKNSSKTQQMGDAHRAKVIQALRDREDVPHFAALADRAAIEATGYNLTVGGYVEAEDTREVIDIKVLNADIADIVARQSALRAELDALVAELEGDAA